MGACMFANNIINKQQLAKTATALRAWLPVQAKSLSYLLAVVRCSIVEIQQGRQG
jgi:hypothetical protein